MTTEKETATVQITVDDMERPSGMIDVLSRRDDVAVTVERLAAGDYIIEDRVRVERKSVDDFVQTAAQKRLFLQCRNLKRFHEPVAMVIEGDILVLERRIPSAASLRGFILSIAVTWQIPIVYSDDVEDTAEILTHIGRLVRKVGIDYQVRHGYKPRRIKNQRLYVLQGLPGIGVKRAKALLDHFGSVEKVMAASAEELQEVEGIGEVGARSLREVIGGEC